MKGYSEIEIFTPGELNLLSRATALVGRVDTDKFKFHKPIRCHELARAVGIFLGLEHEDGVYSLYPETGGGVDHSWLLVPRNKDDKRIACSILDVYAVGRLPQVQLLYCGASAPHHRCFIAREPRTDIDQNMVLELGRQMMGSAEKFVEAMMLVSQTAHPSLETFRLLAQILGYPACPICDYCLPNCKCITEPLSGSAPEAIALNGSCPRCEAEYRHLQAPHKPAGVIMMTVCDCTPVVTEKDGVTWTTLVPPGKMGNKESAP